MHRALRVFLWRNLVLLGLVSAGWLVLTIAFSWILDGYLLGLAQGFFISTLVLLFAVTFLLVSGMTFQLSGAWGEDNTRAELRVAKRRGHIFGWVDNIETRGGDIDHLVVTRAGIYAIDSKWHSHGITDQLAERDARAALASARRARGVLHAAYRAMPVTPLVVVWGGDRDWAKGGKKVDNVTFLSGLELRRWLSLGENTNCIDARQAQELLGELSSFKRRVRPADSV